jgi:hypothetical protein
MRLTHFEKRVAESLLFLDACVVIALIKDERRLGEKASLK